MSLSLRALCPLARIDLPRLAEAGDYAQQGSLVEQAIAFIRKILQEAYEGFEERPVSVRAGFADLDSNGRDFLSLYALPNFLFHYSMTYAILRVEGVPIGKRDFDAFHDYPVGFTFSG
ncbi:DUF1993 family protein [Microbulbifer rhizosphaerae]|uniref:DUF1993 domain-containing protein n=1 Tax=Microbulbifer rhizosphaerae TaxID=1562603 RepID=A0A7W4WDZ7_9GAMM|nr:DUF1993 family protein [Microbulbifer rhizosphaerae]MBB3062469.1 hypothetical protein [Microbulbifer rhizosphaerae]